MAKIDSKSSYVSQAERIWKEWDKRGRMKAGNGKWKRLLYYLEI